MTHVYADGSAENAVRNGKAGVYILYPGSAQTESALLLASTLRTTKRKQSRGNRDSLVNTHASHNVVHLTKASSSQQALQSNRTTDGNGLCQRLAIVFYSILFCSILFYSIFFYSVLFSSLLFYSAVFYSILFYSILFYSILFYSILFYSILFYSILFYSGLCPSTAGSSSPPESSNFLCPCDPCPNRSLLSHNTISPTAFWSFK